MKGKLDDGTPVDIEKPEPIEQDGKWWEFTEYRSVKMGDHYLYEMQDGVGYCIEDHRNVFLHWIASEIPRATAEQLRAIGMKERDGRPVICKHDDVVWNGGGFTRLIDFLKDHGEDIYNRHIGKYRFALVPDVQKEVHISCEGCANWIPCFNEGRCLNCFDRTRTASHVRENYTPKVKTEPIAVSEHHDCFCGGINHLHSVGDVGCLRQMTDAPVRDGFHELGYKMWKVGDARVTDYTLRFQWGYSCHTNGNWSKPRPDKQPPQPKEPKFSVGEIKNYLATRINMAASKESNENLIIAVNEICDPINGIKAFTERRRG